MKSDKELYRELRNLLADQLWNVEVPRFDAATPRERMERVALIRALGVVFAGSGSAEQRAEVRAWLMRLLQDPQEKIRRYAMAALPKIGAGADAERGLLEVLKGATGERERKAAGQVLDKIGGTATLEAGAPLAPQTEQKVRARVARETQPGAIRLDRAIEGRPRLRIHLRCRRGLEGFVRDEAQAGLVARGRVRLLETRPGYVALLPLAPFSLADLYQLRCFASVNFVLGLVKDESPEARTDAVAAAITSPLARHLFATLTEGSHRYRLDFVGRGHQRAAVQQVVTRAYARCPELLNDPRSAPWSVDVYDTPHGLSVELRPRLSPDPRMAYRTDDVAASSHPPLAAAMARLAGRFDHEVVWDPFCGAGLELVECALRGGVMHLFGSDLSPEALAIARANLAAARVTAASTFTCCDFREYAKVPGLEPGRVSLVITNPPMGRRIRLPDPTAFFTDFFAAVAAVLKPGGRLVFANPLRLEPRDLTLKLDYRQVVDLGGFDCRLEVWRKITQPQVVAQRPKPAAKPDTHRPDRKAAPAVPWYSSVAKGRRRR
jgi:23S rRNA G2445 N2-methylase RlmL